jgi:ABC-2 type transport system permease protein
MKSLIRIGTFARKEMTEIIRQPRLLLTLILGPFLILLLFGIGYKNEGKNLRAIVVTSRDNPVQPRIREYARRLGSQFKITGISENLSEAKTKLQLGEVDLVVVVPDQAAQAVGNNRQTVITLLHNEVDPYQAEYVEFTGQLYIDRLNRWLLGSTFEQKKSEAGKAQKDLDEAIRAAEGMRQALQKNDIPLAQQYKEKLNQDLARVEGHVETEITGHANLTPAQIEDVRNRRQALRGNVDKMTGLKPDQPDYLNEARAVAEIEQDLQYIQSRLTEFRKIDTKAVISPFTTKTVSIARSQPKLSQFFIPSVIVLLLQHLAVTFAGLSVVREFRTGAAEIFRVSPLRPIELIIGKYLGYFIIGSLVAVALTASLLFGLKMPMLGDFRYLAGALAVLLFASLSVGFTVSLLAQTETQAIQYTMIFLLVSIFFSGFILNLELLWAPIRVISWILPATYGIQLAQDNILRGEAPDLILLALLATIGAYFFVVSYRILRRRIAEA